MDNRIGLRNKSWYNQNEELYHNDFKIKILNFLASCKTGVNKISAWKTDMESCLTSTYVAVLEIGDGKADQDTDYTRCVAESQILW